MVVVGVNRLSVFPPRFCALFKRSSGGRGMRVAQQLVSLPTPFVGSAMAMNGCPIAAETLEPMPKIAKVEVASNGCSPPPARLLVKKLSAHAIIPSRGSELAAGLDISSAYDDVVPARGKVLIKTDLSIAIPPGTYARLAPRSGLAWKHSIDVGAGVIDADYRGPVGVVLFNHSDQDFSVKAGDRVAQLILEKIVVPEVAEVENLEETIRGEGGFGSTGITAVLSSII